MRGQARPRRRTGERALRTLLARTCFVDRQIAAAEVGAVESGDGRLAFRRATEAIPNPLQLRTIRRDIARIRTILRERTQG